MDFGLGLVINSVMLGVGLAMDAFSVSLVNGLNDPAMKRGRYMLIAGTFAGFQFAMPMIGWACVHSLAEKFTEFQKYIPWIALALLLYIGGKMLIEGIKGDAGSGTEQTASLEKLSLAVLAMQGIATSIDALSVGFTIANYQATLALLSSIIIGIVTFFVCIVGLALGKKFGTKLSGSANIFGGVILILIGLKIALL